MIPHGFSILPSVTMVHSKTLETAVYSAKKSIHRCEHCSKGVCVYHHVLVFTGESSHSSFEMPFFAWFFSSHVSLCICNDLWRHVKTRLQDNFKTCEFMTWLISQCTYKAVCALPRGGTRCWFWTRASIVGTTCLSRDIQKIADLFWCSAWWVTSHLGAGLDGVESSTIFHLWKE